ncbi:vWA domain-containing protein [Lutibaculum baratangense]|nr:VWA domain-containing protein [Lutibaculum baratangense]
MNHLAVSIRSLLVALLAICTAGVASAEPATIVILDGSASMRSQVGGRSKIATVQEAMKEAFEGRAERLGLVVYGGASSSSCEDIATIVPPDGEMDEAARDAAITGIAPKGQTPLAASMESALEDWRDRQPLHLVVIADGTDTCNGDAAAAAAKVKAAGGKVDVIGFVATQPEKVRPLGSVAEAGGGSFAVATSPAAFRSEIAKVLPAPGEAEPDGPAETDAAPDADAEAEAASEEAASDALSSSEEEAADPAGGADGASAADDAGAEVETAQPGIPMPPPRPDPETAAAEPSTVLSLGPLQIQPDKQDKAVRKRLPLRLTAHLTADGPAVPGGVIWRVFNARPMPDGSFPELERSEVPEPVFFLPEGDYIVHAAYGRAFTARQVELHETARDEAVVLEAGGLRVKAVSTDGGALANGISLAIYSSELDEYGQRKQILANAPLDRTIRLNPGTYHIVSRYGDANAIVRADVRVRPGQLTEAAVTHKAAAVTLKLVNEPGGEALANTAWSILSPGGDVVKESFGAFPEHVLAAGTYAVVARHEGRIFNSEFTVEPDRRREVEVVAR